MYFDLGKEFTGPAAKYTINEVLIIEFFRNACAKVHHDRHRDRDMTLAQFAILPS